jgi:hypothetical protein
MMAGILSLRKGDALQVRVEFTNQSDGSEYPMTGWTIEGDMRFANCTPVDLVGTWISEATGVGLVTLAATETTALVVGDYELQVRATSPAGNPTSTDPIIVRVRD